MTTGLVDTSVVIDWHDPHIREALPDEISVTTVTLAELAAGPHVAPSPVEAARRQARLQEVEAKFEPLPLDAAAARSYGLVVAAVVAAGRKHKRRAPDLMIAAIAHANGLDLYTRNPDDFGGLGELVRVFHV